jgi:hydrogenase expression/formation protein HypC
MCLALPMRIITLEGDLATIAAEGLEQRCSLALLPDADVGDYVLVHAGYAISRIDEDEARETYELLAELSLAELGIIDIETDGRETVQHVDQVDRGGRSQPDAGPGSGDDGRSRGDGRSTDDRRSEGDPPSEAQDDGDD